MKKYRIGDTIGISDLFHIGQFNILRMTKERCDFLIVRTNTDGLTKSYEHEKTIIPYRESIPVVEATHYVNKVVLQINLDKIDAWNQPHVDVIFRGNNWEKSNFYINMDKLLYSAGCKMVFLPYTAGISFPLFANKMND